MLTPLSAMDVTILLQLLISTLAPLTCWYVSIYLQRRSPKFHRVPQFLLFGFP